MRFWVTLGSHGKEGPHGIAPDWSLDLFEKVLSDQQSLISKKMQVNCTRYNSWNTVYTIWMMHIPSRTSWRLFNAERTGIRLMRTYLQNRKILIRQAQSVIGVACVLVSQFGYNWIRKTTWKQIRTAGAMGDKPRKTQIDKTQLTHSLHRHSHW